MNDDQNRPPDFGTSFPDSVGPTNTCSEVNVQGMDFMPLRLNSEGDLQMEDPQFTSVAFRSSLESSYPQQGRQPLHQAAYHQHVSVVESLLRAGANVNVLDEHGLSPLHLASGVGNVPIVTALLAANADVSAQDYESSRQAIYLAARNGSLDVLNLLLDKGADVDALNIYGATPLIAAAVGGHIQVVDRLLKNTSSVGASEYENGRQAIHHAAQEGHLKIIDLLLRNGADVNAEDFEGVTPLSLATERGSLPIVSYLLRNGARADIAHGTTRRYAIHQAAQEGHEHIARALHGNSAILDPQASDGITPLHIAARKGHLSMLRFFLQHGANVNATDRDSGLSALHVATAAEKEVCADLLISYGADIHQVTEDGLTALDFACWKAIPSLVQRLLEQNVDLNSRSKETGLFAIHRAAQSGCSDIVKSLLAHGANADALSNYRVTPLWLAVQGRHKDVVEILLNAGTDANIPSSNSLYPIHLAAEGCRLDIVNLLLPYVHNIDVSYIDDVTPLWLAAYKGSDEIVSLLLKNGANCTVVEKAGGRLPIHFAAAFGHLEVVKILAGADSNVDRKAKGDETALWLATHESHLGVVKFLLQHNVDVNATEKESGQSVLHCASAKGDWEIFEALLAQNPAPDPPDRNGITPLWFAAKLGYRSIVKALISRGADLSAAEKSMGFQPIHMAALHNHIDVVRLLLENGVSVDSVTNNNITPLWLAAQGGSTDVARYLLQQEASPSVVDELSQRQAIHQAAQSGHFEIVKMLLESGADHDAREGDGKTALWLAANEGSNDIVSLLLSRNALINVTATPSKIDESEEAEKQGK